MKESKFEIWQEVTHSALLAAKQCPCASGDIEHCFLSLPTEAQIDLYEDDPVKCFTQIHS